MWIEEALPKARVPTDDIIWGDGEQKGGASIMVALGASLGGGLGRPRLVAGSAKMNSEKFPGIRRDAFSVDITDHLGADGYVSRKMANLRIPRRRRKSFAPRKLGPFWQSENGRPRLRTSIRSTTSFGYIPKAT